MKKMCILIAVITYVSVHSMEPTKTNTLTPQEVGRLIKRTIAEKRLCALKPAKPKFRCEIGIIETIGYPPARQWVVTHTYYYEDGLPPPRVLAEWFGDDDYGFGVFD